MSDITAYRGSDDRSAGHAIFEPDYDANIEGVPMDPLKEIDKLIEQAKELKKKYERKPNNEKINKS